jgi:SAM-dependent methyltransferase
MSRQDQKRIDDIYKNTPLEQIPWNSETPPDLLVELVDSAKIQPCKAIDLGCGAGNYAVYLAARGFEVTGVDFSPTAIAIAKQNAERKGLKCNFFVANLLDWLPEINQTWDFAYDWGLLHHISGRHRKKYVSNVFRILNPRSKYLSVCFSENDTAFGGSGKYRKTPLGSTLYFSTQEELSGLFGLYFRIIDLRTVEISGKFEPHVFNYVFMEKKEIDSGSSKDY